MKFENQIIAIIGAGGAIGSALARRIRAEGGQPLLIGRSLERLAALATALQAPVEILEAADFDLLEAAIKRHAPINGIVNCAGSILLKPAHATSSAEWSQLIETNLTTSFSAIRAGVKSFPATGGSIVLVSSAAARVGLANHDAIAAAKAGVIGLTLSAAATYAQRDIRVNCVALGLVDTPLASKITSNEVTLRASVGMHPLGRIGKPEDVASAIAWLLDPQNSWVTGQVLGVDGGLGSIRARQ